MAAYVLVVARAWDHRLGRREPPPPGCRPCASRFDRRSWRRTWPHRPAAAVPRRARRRPGKKPPRRWPQAGTSPRGPETARAGPPPSSRRWPPHASFRRYPGSGPQTRRRQAGPRCRNGARNAPDAGPPGPAPHPLSHGRAGR
ncbi:hypothetical protein NY78_3137 [Desulfovibrio sp. TomC]|nr:hypothetical protein NY78_3137 [Desulfovibrio sp. TomC]